MYVLVQVEVRKKLSSDLILVPKCERNSLPFSFYPSSLLGREGWVRAWGIFESRIHRIARVGEKRGEREELLVSTITTL